MCKVISVLLGIQFFMMWSINDAYEKLKNQNADLQKCAPTSEREISHLAIIDGKLECSKTYGKSGARKSIRIQL